MPLLCHHHHSPLNHTVLLSTRSLQLPSYPSLLHCSLRKVCMLATIVNDPLITASTCFSWSEQPLIPAGRSFLPLTFVFLELHKVHTPASCFTVCRPLIVWYFSRVSGLVLNPGPTGNQTWGDHLLLYKGWALVLNLPVVLLATTHLR